MGRISPCYGYKRDSEGKGYLEVCLRGVALLRTSATNKGTEFTEKERRELGLEGALPPQVTTLVRPAARFPTSNTTGDRFPWGRATMPSCFPASVLPQSSVVANASVTP